MNNTNLATITGFAFFVLGIGGFVATIILYDPSLYDTEDMLNTATFNTFIIATMVLIVNSAIGAFLFTLGKIQIALESISNK